MYKKFNFEEMSTPELLRKKEMNEEFIDLNNQTGMQSDYERNFFDDETKRFETEILEIDKIIQRREKNK